MFCQDGRRETLLLSPISQGSNPTSWTLTKSEGSGSRKNATHRGALKTEATEKGEKHPKLQMHAFFRQQPYVVSETARWQWLLFRSLLLNKLHISTSNIKGGDLLFLNTNSHMDAHTNRCERPHEKVLDSV